MAEGIIDASRARWMTFDEHAVRARRGGLTNEQAALLRAGKLDQLDLEHIAEEIEDVGKSEQRELAHRMAVLGGWPNDILEADVTYVAGQLP